jgi:hypothetical protein
MTATQDGTLQISDLWIPDVAAVGISFARAARRHRHATCPCRAAEADRVTREDIWPSEADYGVPVLLAGGEVGRLAAWWNAPDYAAWRWSIELYNHR